MADRTAPTLGERVTRAATRSRAQSLAEVAAPMSDAATNATFDSSAVSDPDVLQRKLAETNAVVATLVLNCNELLGRIKSLEERVTTLTLPAARAPQVTPVALFPPQMIPAEIGNAADPSSERDVSIRQTLLLEVEPGAGKPKTLDVHPDNSRAVKIDGVQKALEVISRYIKRYRLVPQSVADQLMSPGAQQVLRDWAVAGEMPLATTRDWVSLMLAYVAEFGPSLAANLRSVDPYWCVSPTAGQKGFVP